MDKFQEIHVFVSVAEQGSFVSASQSLRMSKAAVSRHVSELEKRLGVRLIHRTTRRLSLTPEGEIFLARCREILTSIEASEDEIQTHRLTASGTLRVTGPVSFGIKHLAPLWSDFLREYPSLKLELELSDRVIDLVDEGYDLAIRIGQLSDSTLISRTLTRTRLVLCASPDYLSRRGAPNHPSELAQHETFAYSLLSTGDSWRFMGPDGAVDVRVTARMRSNNGDTGVEVCLRGGGVHLWPTFLIEDHLRSGRLIELLPEFRAPTLGINAVYPSRKLVSPKVRAAVEFLETRLGQSSWASI